MENVNSMGSIYVITQAADQTYSDKSCISAENIYS